MISNWIFPFRRKIIHRRPQSLILGLETIQFTLARLNNCMTFAPAFPDFAHFFSVDLKIKSPPTVKFLFLTIEGNKTFQFFEKNGEIVQLNDCLFSYKNGVVYVDFEDSIVEKQTEYLVNLEDLREITDMDVRYEKDATEEKFLSEKEKVYTSLYVYGEYELPNKPIYIFRT